MKKAVIVVGKHYVGKSKTINNHLKPKLKIGKRNHKFSRNGQEGFILSQSFEEAGRDVDFVVSKYSHYELLVLSARPANKSTSCLDEAESKLKKAGYQVNLVYVSKTTDNMHYDDKADEIIKYLDK